MLRAVIIDDEVRAQRVLVNLLKKFCPNVTVLEVCSNVPDAVIAINAHAPDVVFTDIEMPNYSGFELLSFFKEVNFELVFTTGYNEYALKAFEVSAVDYLLKPIQIEQLEKTVAKLEKLKQVSMQTRLEVLSENLKTSEINKIALPTLDGLLFVAVDEIIYLEADGAYTKVHVKNSKNLLVSKKLKYFELLLENRSQFYRVHRSTIININSIVKYSKSDNYISLDNGISVGISRDKKTAFEEHIKSIRL